MQHHSEIHAPQLWWLTLVFIHEWVHRWRIEFIAGPNSTHRSIEEVRTKIASLGFSRSKNDWWNRECWIPVFEQTRRINWLDWRYWLVDQLTTCQPNLFSRSSYNSAPLISDHSYQYRYLILQTFIKPVLASTLRLSSVKHTEAKSCERMRN